MENRFNFRLFDIEKKIMITKYNCNKYVNTRGGAYSGEEWYPCFDFKIPFYFEEFIEEYSKQFIFMQCSTRKDKKNTLIYDGDIVKRQNRYIGVVIFQDGCFKIKWQDGVYYGWARHIDDYQQSSLEIIGNIYENPELLGVNNGK